MRTPPPLADQADLETIARRALRQIADQVSRTVTTTAARTDAELHPALQVARTATPNLAGRPSNRRVGARVLAVAALLLTGVVVAALARSSGPTNVAVGPLPAGGPWLLPDLAAEGFTLTDVTVGGPLGNISVVRKSGGTTTMAVHLVQLSGSATTAESAIRDLPGSRPEVRDEQVIRLADAPNGGQRAGRMVEGCGYVMLEGWGFSVEDAAGILNFLSCSYEGAPLGIGPWPGGPGIAFAGGVAAVDITLEYRAQDGTTVWLRQLRPKGQPLEHFFPYPGVEAATGARIPRASDERPWSAAWSGASGTVFLASARDALDLALLRARLTPVSGTALLDLLDRRSVNLTEAERAAVLGGSD